MGYSLVHGAWVDRVAEGGETRAAPSLGARGDRMADAFPLQCAVGSCLDPHHVGFEAGWKRNVQTGEHTHALRGLHHYSTLVGVVGGGRRVLAHRAQYPILDARTLQDFGLDDVVSATRLMEDHEAVARTARSVFALADAANDQPSADLLTQRLQVHEKTAWMLRSLLQN